MSDLDGHADERPTKRRRVATACQPCRDRKSKCDGAPGLCSTCRQMGTECSYPTTLSKTDALRQEFTSLVGGLEERMRGIESLLSSLESRLGSIAAATPLSSASRAPEASGFTTHSPDTEITISEDALQGGTQNESASDGIGIVPLTSRDDCAFFGPSSNIAFLRLVSRALAKVAGATATSSSARRRATDWPQDAGRPREQLSFSTRPGLFGFSVSRPNGRCSTKYSIPADHNARQLISAYFTSCGHVHPYIHEGRFMDTYDEMRRTGFTKVRRSWLALLYIIFAISSGSWPYITATVAATNAESEAFYQIASDLCLQQVFSESAINLEVVQCLLLMGLYLQGTHNSMKTALIHGLAVKLAYQLGIHSSETSGITDPVECEVRTRVWYGLVLIDRTLSMTVGRPPEIQSSTRSRPQICPDAVERGNFEQDKLSISFLCTTIDLYEIMQRTITTLFERNCGPRMSLSMESLAKIYMLEGEIVEWKDNVTPHLAIMRDDELPVNDHLTEPNAILKRRQRTVMSLRYLSTRILIHRPALEALLDAVMTNEAGSEHFKSMKLAAANSITIEIQCAIRLIKIVNHLVSEIVEGHQQLGAWWFSLFYVFNASLAILGCLLIARPRWGGSDILADPDREAASQALQQSLRVLDGLDEGHSTIARCRNYLQELIKVAEPLRPVTPSAEQYLGLAQRSGLPRYNAVSDRNTLHAAEAFQPTQFQPLVPDVNLENFLFPLDIEQMFGGQMVGMDQPFV